MFPLVLNVLPHDVLIETDCGDGVSSRPEVFGSERAAALGIETVRADGALPFEESDDVGNRVFRWNGDDEVQMIGERIAFDDLAFLLLGELADDFPDLDSGFREEDLLSVFGYNDDVVPTVPFHMTLRFE